ncbi:MAG: proprotein convertase P-domain-containing protein [Saprospiraceae bacterium]
MQIVMNWQCEAVVQPDQLLEGNYSDYSIFTVNILDDDGNSIGNVLTSEYVGTVVMAEVYDNTTQNKCWSAIQVVDNYAPVFTCDSVFTTCYSDPEPGSLLPENYRFSFSPNAEIPDEDTLEIEFYVGEIQGATLSDFNVRLNILHDRVLDLGAYLISPNNDTVNLFDNLTCGNADFDVVFDDQASKTSSDLSSACCPCAPDPSVSGTYQPLGSLSVLNGEVPGGVWKLRVYDKNQDYTGVLKNVDLIFKQTGGVLVFPLPAGTATPVSNGFQSYIVSFGFDPCGEVLLTYTDEIVSEDCSTGLTSTIYRTWEAEDQSGNISHCTQVIEVLNTGLAFLEFPENYDNIENPALSCQPSNPDFYPFPSLTGYPESELCSMIQYSYEDQLINTCSGSFKVVRHWRVTEMCSAEVHEHDQLIMVADKTVTLY